MITKSISSIRTVNQNETVFSTLLGRYEREKGKGKTFICFIAILYLTYFISSYLKVAA